MNIFDLEGLSEKEEVIKILAESKNVKIEKIISTGQTTDWQESEQNEFVILVQGEAEIEYFKDKNFEKNENIIKGDKYDNVNNRNLWKFKMLATEKEITNNKGEKETVMERDHETVRRDFLKALSTQLLNSTSVNISHTTGDDSLSVTLVDFLCI